MFKFKRFLSFGEKIVVGRFLYGIKQLFFRHYSSHSKQRRFFRIKLTNKAIDSSMKCEKTRSMLDSQRFCTQNHAQNKWISKQSTRAEQITHNVSNKIWVNLFRQRNICWRHWWWKNYLSFENTFAVIITTFFFAFNLCVE